MTILADNNRDFSENLACVIVIEVSMGAAVHTLHNEYPDRVPNPIIINRWRREVPQFDMLMQEAEMSKAQMYADETIGISDDTKLKASERNVRIKARQWYAGKMAGAFKDEEGGIKVDATIRLSDEQLMAIASQGRPLLEGRSERVDTQAEPVLRAPATDQRDAGRIAGPSEASGGTERGIAPGTVDEVAGRGQVGVGETDEDGWPA